MSTIKREGEKTQVETDVLESVRSRIDELREEDVVFPANPDVSESLLERADNCETWDGDNSAPKL